MKHFILCLLLAVPAFADFSTLPDGVKANLDAIQKYSKAASVLLWVKDSYELQENGAQVYERHEFRYLPDEAARDLWGDPHISYVEGRQKIEILAARSYTSDSRTIDATPHNAFNPVTPEELGHAPDFADFRQMVVTLLGLENGSITELHYRLSAEKPLYPWLWGRVYFREESPTIARELAVKVPRGQELNYKLANGLSEPLVTNSTYIWRMGEQPGYLADDLRGHRVLLPNVAFTTAKDWPEVASELKTRIASATDGVTLPKSLQAKLAGAMEGENRLDSIKVWLRERFNELSFEHPDFLAFLRPASRVLESGYGNSLEIAVLAAKLCAQADVTASVVPWFEFEPPVPSLYDLVGGLLFVKGTVETIETHPLLPRNEFPRLEIADATFLLLDEQGTITTRHPAKSSSAVRLSLNLTALDADTLRGTGTLSTHFWWTPYEALRSDAMDYVQSLLTLNGFNVESAQLQQLGRDNAALNFAFTASALDTADSHHLLPTSAMDFSQYAGNPNFNLETKAFPHYVKLPGEISVHLETPVPDGWTVAQPLPALTRAWKDGSGMRTVEVKDGRVIVEEKLTLGSPWIQAEDWPVFRSFLLEIGDRPNNIIVFSDKAD